MSEPQVTLLEQLLSVVNEVSTLLAEPCAILTTISPNFHAQVLLWDFAETRSRVASETEGSVTVSFSPSSVRPGEAWTPVIVNEDLLNLLFGLYSLMQEAWNVRITDFLRDVIIRLCCLSGQGIAQSDGEHSLNRAGTQALCSKAKRRLHRCAEG